MELLSKLWSAAIAYVALFVGAGLSIAGNIADTYRTRGALTDVLDVILAGAAPLCVLLTIELFVSRRWSPKFGFQVLRWLGCMSIGVLAMAVSWVHLHDLLLSRGQLPAVAAFWPFAIDGMAIMATGLILSTRDSAKRVEVMSHIAGALDTFATGETTSESGDLWERLGQEMSTADAPVSPAPFDLTSASEPEATKQRTPRGEISPALKAVVSELINGETPAIREGASKATIARYARVWRILRDNPNSDIDLTVHKVRTELVDDMRAAARLEVVR